MKILIKLEEAALFLSSLYFLNQLNLDLSWWMYLLLFLSPDLGMLGYLHSALTGAITYNLLHHKALAIACIVLGYGLSQHSWLFAGFMLLAHSSFDRLMGYGLKYTDSFKHTSIGNL